ncbi:hypothetical protein FGB62_172g014 [Gracilaria domingensis]|nr:hypothetical protein FGB62_172g014 [Gracilaria domingensis]
MFIGQPECFNVFWSARVPYHVEESVEAELPWEKTIRVRMGNRPNGLILMHLNVHNDESESSSESNDNRFLCLERPLQESRSSPLFTGLNCVLGKWNPDASSFTFRVGFGTVSIPTWKEHVESNSIPKVISFTSFSSQITLVWAASDGAEDALSDGFRLLKEDVVTSCEFVDSVVARAIVAREAKSRERLLRASEVSVTKIAALGSWCYSFILLLTCVILVFQLVLRDRFALRLKENDGSEIRLDVSGYGGLLKWLARDHREGFDRSQDTVAFSITHGKVRLVEQRDGQHGYP